MVVDENRREREREVGREREREKEREREREKERGTEREHCMDSLVHVNIIQFTFFRCAVSF